MNTNDHSPIGASSMYRWSVCPGSVALSKDIETIQSAYAEEGTEAHDLAARWLKSNGKTPPCDNDEMLEAVKVYVDYVFDLMAAKAVLLVEHGFDLSSLYPGLWGTADAVVWLPATHTLHVIDFKFGAGILVEVTDNPQALYYALGALMSLNLPVEDVVITIVQPRCAHQDGPIRSQSMKAIDLLDFATDLIMYAKNTEAKDAPLVAGDHCRFCPAVRVCPEIEAQRNAVATLEFGPTLSYDPKELQRALDTIPLLEAWIKAVDAFAYQEAEAGRPIPGYKLVDKRATRKWIDENEVSLFLGTCKVPDDQIFEPRKIKSPAQMEQSLPNHASMLKKFITKKSSGHVLVPESDKRPAVAISAADEFLALDAPVDPFA